MNTNQKSIKETIQGNVDQGMGTIQDTINSNAQAPSPKTKPLLAADSDNIIGYNVETRQQEITNYIYENQGLATGPVYNLAFKQSKAEKVSDVYAKKYLKEQFVQHDQNNHGSASGT